jgi:hypothetical protein
LKTIENAGEKKSQSWVTVREAFGFPAEEGGRSRFRRKAEMKIGYHPIATQAAQVFNGPTKLSDISRR